jgi:hypothetical protein
MPNIDGEKFDYDVSGLTSAGETSAQKKPEITPADVREAVAITTSGEWEKESPFDRGYATVILKRATPEQKAAAREDLNIPEGMNMGGVIVDELGYMQGGMSYDNKSGVKYSEGGAVKGKTFRGSF